MRPLKLEFEGINSFSEHTIIDFEKLTKNGIFGIFGDTGSGKSTILDSINFALYGNVERSREKTDIINYKCESAKVKFEFNIIHEGKRKIYTVERLIRRDKSGTHKAQLYVNDGRSEVCLADKPSQVEKKVIEILGVEADDFRKCIALPQGEFAQFVKSAPRERLALIERLFSLSKYGDKLREKLSVRQSETENVFQNISGRMQAYENVTAEALNDINVRLNDKRKQLGGLNLKINDIAAECERLRLLSDKRKELDLTLQKLDDLSAKKPEIDELKNALSLLAYCREAVEVNDEALRKNKIAEDINRDIVRLQSQFKSDEKSLKALEKTIKENCFDEKIAEFVAKATVYNENAGKVEKLDNLLAELEIKRAEYRKKDGELAALIKERETLLTLLEKEEKSLGEIVDIDISKVINREFKASLLRREYVDVFDYFKDLEDGIEIYKEDTPLYKFVKPEVKRKVNEYKERLELTGNTSGCAVEEQIESYRSLLKARDERQKTVNSYTVRLHSLDGEIKLKKKELEISKKDGVDLRLRANEVENELESAFGTSKTDFSALIEANKRELNFLKQRKEELSDKLEEIKNSKNSSELSIEKLKTLYLSAQTEIGALKIKLQNLLKKCGFESVDKCLNLTERFKNITDAEKIVSDFENLFGALTVRKKELESIDGIYNTPVDRFAEVESERQKLTQSCSVLTGEIAVLEANEKTLKVKLEEKAALDKEYERAVKERDLISRLKDVTKGNKFLEYIANEYLCDISSLASSTLLKLRDGRYFLTYKDNNFYVGDNYNCGNLRGVNTLSGGETFLVSLSLALALSQTICAKSMKSIEFFFLDEGFGTLDSSLVDTVMNALEKLKSSAFTIGVISHVEELKHRIDSKITVNKATETCGSTVSVSC